VDQMNNKTVARINYFNGILIWS